MLGLPSDVRAVLFDLDGVLTDTAAVHKAAWKQMFDEFLRGRTESSIPFDARTDYEMYVDGKLRPDGVRDFLASRDIRLPEGDPDDPCRIDTVNGLGNRKNAELTERIRTDGVRVFEGSRRYLEAARDSGLRRAVVSSSANAADVLEVTGLTSLVELLIDGNTIREEGLRGKPAPGHVPACGRATRRASRPGSCLRGCPRRCAGRTSRQLPPSRRREPGTTSGSFRAPRAPTSWSTT